MRKLMWIGAGFTVACVLGAYFLTVGWLCVLGSVFLLSCFVLLHFFKGVCWQRAAAFVLLGTAAGMLWFSLYCTIGLAPAKAANGQVRSVCAEVTEYSYDTGYGTGVQAQIELDGKPFACKLYLDEGLSLSPGDRIEGSFYLCYTGTQGEKESVWHSGAGIFLLGYQRDEVHIQNAQGQTLRHFPARLRNSILQTTERLFTEDTAGFAKALLLGDTTGISYETRSALTVSGIVHVVSVSGLHVSILLSLVFLFIGRNKFLTPILGSAILILAAAVTGFSPSIVRACLMNGLMLFALMVDREYDPLTALAFALIVMLGINPLSITSVGLQLSAASVLGIHLFAGRVGDWIRSRNFWAEARRKSLLFRLREWLASTVSVSLGATIATAPLTALHFGSVSLIGGLTNLAVLWLINYVFVGIIFAVIISTFWTWGARMLAIVLGWAIRFVLAVAKLFCTFPLAAVYTESPYITVWLLCFYAMLICFGLMKRKRRLQLCLWTAVTLIAAVALSWIEPRLDNYRVTVVDVGQGQCVLLQSQGRVYMVDCGGSFDRSAADKAVATAHSQGIFWLDGLILTHYDRDHVGAATYLLSRLPAKELYLPTGPGESQWRPLLEEAVKGQTVDVQQDLCLEWGDAKLTIFPAVEAETSNESSLCILFQAENYDILITGDQSVAGEIALLAARPIPMLDALVVGHHGSDSATGEYLLEHTRPTVALISVGRDNSYGHPAQQVLERLARFGCIIRRTDLEGTIIMRG